MKVRSRKPAAGIARASVIQTETSRQRYIATVRARYGTTEVATSKRLRRSDGCSYRAIDSRQNGRVEYESAFGAEVICEAAFKASYGTRVLAFKRSRSGRRAAVAKVLTITSHLESP